MIENLQLQLLIGKDDTIESKNSMAELVIEFNKLKKLRDATIDNQKKREQVTRNRSRAFMNDLIQEYTNEALGEKQTDNDIFSPDADPVEITDEDADEYTKNYVKKLMIKLKQDDKV